MIADFYTLRFIAMHRRQLSAKYICLKSKYRIALRAVINDKIYDGLTVASAYASIIQSEFLERM